MASIRGYHSRPVTSSSRSNMYGQWKSLQTVIHSEIGNKSVLHHFPESVAHDVSKPIVKHLSLTLNQGIQSFSQSQTHLDNDQQLEWTMEVLCYGLSLPLNEFESIRDCVSVYTDWLTALSTPKPSVPKPVINDPNKYSQKILQHLYNLFEPRNTGSGGVKQQVLLCQHVLVTVQNLAKESNLINRKTWEVLLLFLLAVCDKLLAPPVESHGIGEELCELLLSTLFEVWLRACYCSFPSPTLWRTLRDLARLWRHQPALVNQWTRINIVLTSRLLKFTYGPQFPEINFNISPHDAQIIPADMSHDCTTQTWFRFLHTIGNPAELSNAGIISQTPKFMQIALASEEAVAISQHPCLAELPHIFLRSMNGISVMADAFLGIASPSPHSEAVIDPNAHTTGATPPNGRKLTKAVSTSIPGMRASSARTSSVGSHSSLTVPTSISASKSSIHTQLAPEQHKAYPHRASSNSILHLFGKWLFDAALVGVGSKGYVTDPGPQIDSSPHSFEPGRAEACGSLCRLFTLKKYNEDILPEYLARFYQVIDMGLRIDQNMSGQVLAGIIVNSIDILHIDLKGVHVLIPRLLSAIEIILADNLPTISCHVPDVELRRASIRLMLSMHCLPLHFKDLPIEEIQTSPIVSSQHHQSDGARTFHSIAQKTADLLIGALQCENDPINTQMVLGGLLTFIQDAALSEETMSAEEKEHHPVKSYDLFVRAIHLVCQRMFTWKLDLNVSLAALEFLCGLAKIKLKIKDVLECKRAVKWICDYIVQQCSRPPPYHSRDLHSMIVAAFHCLTVWLIEHPYILDDKVYLCEVLEVVELGISGTKSMVKKTDTPKYKSQKQLMPASLRVREAGEDLLGCLLENVGSFPQPLGPMSVCTLMNEDTLMEHVHGTANNNTKFKYVAVNNAIIVGLMEQPLGNDQDPLPTVIVLNRTATGRHSWIMQSRQFARHDKIGAKSHLQPPIQPQGNENVYMTTRKHVNYFPTSVDQIGCTNADYSIPPLSSIPSDRESLDLEELKRFIESQAEFEADVVRQHISSESNTHIGVSPPKICQEFQPARLLLSHLGLLSLESLHKTDSTSAPPALVGLASDKQLFLTDIHQLDMLPGRVVDTVHVFYVKSGQTSADDILNNVNDVNNVDVHFIEMLHSLGWPVNVKQHCGWTGHVSTSWKCDNKPDTTGDQGDEVFLRTGGGQYNGVNQVLYWADVLTEVAFIVPTKPEQQKVATSEQDSSVPATATGVIDNLYNTTNTNTPDTMISQQELHHSSTKDTNLDDKPKHLRTLSLDLTATSSPRPDENRLCNVATTTRSMKFANKQAMGLGPDTKVFVIWLESYDDKDGIPIDVLLNGCATGIPATVLRSSGASLLQSTNSNTDPVVIFISPLQSYLFRVKIQCTNSRLLSAVPLVNSMVVSRRALGIMIRQTAMNICQRRRLDSENFSSPHVRRKLMIQDIIKRYQMKITEPELYTSLFQ